MEASSGGSDSDSDSHSDSDSDSICCMPVVYDRMK